MFVDVFLGDAKCQAPMLESKVALFAEKPSMLKLTILKALGLTHYEAEGLSLYHSTGSGFSWCCGWSPLRVN